MKLEDIPTPRTDAMEFAVRWIHDTRRLVVDSDKCRQLERELAEANADRRGMFPEWSKFQDDAMRLAGENSDLERQLEKAKDDNAALLERLAERTRDYTSHAARELDKLRAVEKDAGNLAGALEELEDLMEGVIEGDYKPDSFTNQVARTALNNHKARIKSIS